MNIRKIIVALSLVITSLIAASNAQAESNASKAKHSISVIKSEVKKLKRLLNRPGVRAQLGKVTASSNGLRDSDDDGMPDIIENVEGTDSCIDDSDGDGISDGDEQDSGSNPDDSTSSEVEVKNTITAITATTVSVAGYTFTVADTTLFKGKTSLSAFSLGDFVEASGKMSGGILILKKLSLED